MNVMPGPAHTTRRRRSWYLIAGMAAAVAVAVTAGMVLNQRSALDPSQVPIGDRCIAEPGAEQLDVDTDDSPETPWEHVPGQGITVYFETGELPSRYSAFVEEGAALWSRSPCIDALAVETCPDGANCSAVVVEARSSDDDDTDGESEGVDRGGVRIANTITLYTDLLDETSDNGALVTVVHEMGHALGLVHRNNPHSMMNAETDDHTDPVPDAIDFANLVAIYGAEAD